MFLMYSIDNSILVELFCQLLLNEVASKVSTWRTIGTELMDSVDTALTSGYRLFFTNDLNQYVHQYQLNDITQSRFEQHLDRLLPAENMILDGFDSTYIQGARSRYKTLQSRAFYMNAIYYSKRGREAMSIFRSDCLEYLGDKMKFIQRSDISKLWYSGRNGVDMYKIIGE